MSLFPLQFQIASDLHLETPLTKPSYSMGFSCHGNNLCLLGDIGLVTDGGLFGFLGRILERSKGIRIFYVLGNHEPYRLSFEDAILRIRSFEEQARVQYGGRFIFLHRDRYDVDNSTTILGCTLWSAISPDQGREAQIRLTDFNEERGIQGWTLERHLEEHKRDVDWLNEQVQVIHEEEPHRQIVILTHHCPTVDLRAINPKHQGSSISTGFASDLERELCWTCPAVKLWAFGHTHYNCAFHDEKTGKLVLANQKGYSKIEDTYRNSVTMHIALVEAHSERWKLVHIPQQHETEVEKRRNQVNKASERSSKLRDSGEAYLKGSYNNAEKHKRTLFQRAVDRIQAIRR